jgi:hypothetical protein
VATLRILKQSQYKEYQEDSKQSNGKIQYTECQEHTIYRVLGRSAVTCTMLRNTDWKKLGENKTDDITVLSIRLILTIMKMVSHVYRRPMRCSSKQSLFYTANSPYVFRVSPAPIISSTQTVVTATGTSHELGDVVIKSV